MKSIIDRWRDDPSPVRVLPATGKEKPTKFRIVRVAQRQEQEVPEDAVVLPLIEEEE